MILKKIVKVTFHQSACVLIEGDGVKILCDPWLVDGAYIGSWHIYPPYEFQPNEFNDVDYIYVSHIHPDHFNDKTLMQLNKDIPVLIHNFPIKVLKKNIERLGFKTIEIEHDIRTHLKNKIHINILAADDCDPQLCGKHIGCVNLMSPSGTNWIDTMCVIDDGDQVVVNTNDCPYELAQFAATRIKNNYEHVDMLLNGYAGASAYPHMFKMTDNEKEIAADTKKSINYKRGENYIKLLEPKYFMPFSGRYTLGGKLSIHYGKRGEPELEEGFNHLVSVIDQNKSKGILINAKETFDLTTEKSSNPYVPINLEEKKAYIKNVLSKRKMDYENDIEPSIEELKKLLIKSYERFERMRKKFNYNSDVVIIIGLSTSEFVIISCKGEKINFVNKEKLSIYNKYVKMSLDSKLLKLLLEGPSKAHWNIAEGGGHIYFERVPEKYELGLFYCLYNLYQ